MEFAVLKDAAERSGDTIVPEFTGKVKNPDNLGLKLEEGQIIEFPPLEHAQRVPKEVQGSIDPKTGKPYIYECLWVLLDGKPFRFPMGTFTKVAYECDPDTLKTVKIQKPEGSVIEVVKKLTDNEEVLKALAGKKMKVAKVREYTVKLYEQDETDTAKVFDFDFV